MSYYDEPLEKKLITPAHWSRIQRALTPLIGDPESTLGSEWQSTIRLHFNVLDLLTAHLALASKEPIKHFLIRWGPAGKELVGDRASVFEAAHSVEGALASLLQSAYNERSFPDSSHIDKDGKIRFTLAGQVWATVEKMVFQTEPPALIARAKGTLSKLRKAGDVGDELLKRLHRWPGTEGYRLDESYGLLSPLHDNSKALRRRTEQSRHFHLSVPCEWLLSAKQLCTLAGYEPTQKLAEDVCAAIFDLTDWHQLAAAMTRHVDGIFPWVVFQTRDLGGDSVDWEPLEHSFHRDPFEALPSLLTLAEKASVVDPEWNSGPRSSEHIEVAYGSVTGDVMDVGGSCPYYLTISPKWIGEKAFDETPFAEQLQVEASGVSLVHPGKFIGLVQNSLSDTAAPTLAELDHLFMTRSSPHERAQRVDSERRLEPIFDRHGVRVLRPHPDQPFFDLKFEEFVCHEDNVEVEQHDAFGNRVSSPINFTRLGAARIYEIRGSKLRIVYASGGILAILHDWAKGDYLSLVKALNARVVSVSAEQVDADLAEPISTFRDLHPIARKLGLPESDLPREVEPVVFAIH